MNTATSVRGAFGASWHSRTKWRGDGKLCLVAGGAGFLGSHLCRRLLSKGRRVLCIDNLQTGSWQNVARLEGAGFSFRRHDIVAPIQLNEPVAEIYNLACAASPEHYQADPIHTTRTNVVGALNLLETATKHQARIFQASTSEVYGDPDVHPQPESYRGNVNPHGPRACYDEGKRCAESLFFDFKRRYGTSIRVARIFNTYGPQMSVGDGRVVSNFIVQALTGDDLTIYGDGLQTRSLCYVDDLIDGFIGMMEAEEDFETPINLGNPVELQVRELAQMVIAITGSRSKIVYRPLPVDDPRQRRPDISLAQQELEWQPRVALEEGLRRTVDYFDGILSSSSGGRRAGLSARH